MTTIFPCLFHCFAWSINLLCWVIGNFVTSARCSFVSWPLCPVLPPLTPSSPLSPLPCSPFLWSVRSRSSASYCDKQFGSLDGSQTWDKGDNDALYRLVRLHCLAVDRFSHVHWLIGDVYVNCNWWSLCSWKFFWVKVLIRSMRSGANAIAMGRWIFCLK